MLERPAPREAFPLVLKILEDPGVAPQAFIVEAPGKIDRKEAVPHLEKLLPTENRTYRIVP